MMHLVDRFIYLDFNVGIGAKNVIIQKNVSITFNISGNAIAGGAVGVCHNCELINSEIGDVSMNVENGAIAGVGFGTCMGECGARNVTVRGNIDITATNNAAAGLLIGSCKDAKKCTLERIKIGYSTGDHHNDGNGDDDSGSSDGRNTSNAFSGMWFPN